MQRAIALVDCNNFYVSCERLFQPRLEGKPVVVLSNNDGCVVSRSQEVKDLGINMAVPWFKIKDIAQRHGIVALSSNYTLYADLSNRVMSLLSQFAPEQEVYSIDESFLDLTGMAADHTVYGQRMRDTVKRCVGIPVCVDIASSKTLAKLANYVTKKQARFGEVWGVGRRSSVRLQEMGIHTVPELKRTSAERIRDKFSVVLERTVAELNGTACLELDKVIPDMQQIICSRSFGTLVSNLSDLEQAVVSYVTRATEKLRGQHSIAGGIQVYIRTNPHKERDPQYQRSMVIPLESPTDDTRTLCHAALSGLKQIYRTGFACQKAGVMLMEIIPRASRPRTLFDDVAAEQKSHALMTTLDTINRRMGSGSMWLLGEGIKQSWVMRRDNVSQRYTTE